MPLKRKIWNLEEDQRLKLIASNGSPIIDWERVALDLSVLGYKKTPTQCKNRWLRFLSPNLNKNKWTREESINIVKMVKKYNANWKIITEHFSDRTDNTIKNEFFNVMRKCLRLMCKYLDLPHKTKEINVIKPKYLIMLILGKFGVELPIEFIEIFAFKLKILTFNEFSENDIKLIKDCIDKLFTFCNLDFKKERKIKKKARNMSRSFDTEPSLISSAYDNSHVYIETDIGYLIDNRKNIDNNTNEFHDIGKNYANKISILYELNNQIKETIKNGTQDLKIKLSAYFTLLQDISHQLKKALVSCNAKDQDCINNAVCLMSDILENYELNFKDNQMHIEMENSEFDPLNSIKNFGSYDNEDCISILGDDDMQITPHHHNDFQNEKETGSQQRKLTVSTQVSTPLVKDKEGIDYYYSDESPLKNHEPQERQIGRAHV